VDKPSLHPAQETLISRKTVLTIARILFFVTVSVSSARIREETRMKLNIKAFALTCALVWGLGVFFLTWWIMAFDGTTGETTWLGQVYRGYRITPLGSVIGMAWGFADAFAGGLVFAWLYNWLVTRFTRT